MGKALPSETAVRACVAKLASQKEQIQELLRDKNFFKLWMKQIAKLASQKEQIQELLREKIF